MPSSYSAACARPAAHTRPRGAAASSAALLLATVAGSGCSEELNLDARVACDPERGCPGNRRCLPAPDADVTICRPPGAVDADADRDGGAEVRRADGGDAATAGDAEVADGSDALDGAEGDAEGAASDAPDDAGETPEVDGAHGPETTDGTSTEVETELPPPPESCNGADDDGDGATDEGLDDPDAAGCAAAGVCAEDAGSIVARCADGSWQCDYAAVEGFEVADGGACEPDDDAPCHCPEAGAACTRPEEQSCDAQDDDCDGTTDEGFGLGEACGTGDCAGGVRECVPDDAGTRCSSMPGGSEDASAPELCNGADDDCDGATDEDFGAGGEVVYTEPDGETTRVLGESCGLGACHGGEVVCSDDGDSLVCPTLDAQGLESCNGVDDDCDGLADEGAGCDCGELGVPCPEGYQCNAQGWCVDDYDASPTSQKVWMPSGTFWMGCNDVVDGVCFPDEKPQHEVDVPAVVVDATEVTAEAYADFLNARASNGCPTPDGGTLPCVDADDPDLPLDEGESGWAPKDGLGAAPITDVTWYGARAYCASQGGRLCTEAEWEKAARGGCALYDGSCAESMPKYPWGSNTEPECGTELANTDNCVGYPTPVGSYPDGVSPYGAYDLIGNVTEWVRDCYHPSYEGAPSDGSAWGGANAPCEEGGRIVRGGAYSKTNLFSRSAYRSESAADGAFDNRGFRCCHAAP